jgi:hypothetical protein
MVCCANFASFITEILTVVVEYRWIILMLSGIGLIFGASYVESGIRRISGHWVKTTN